MKKILAFALLLCVALTAFAFAEQEPGTLSDAEFAAFADEDNDAFGSEDTLPLDGGEFVTINGADDPEEIEEPFEDEMITERAEPVDAANPDEIETFSEAEVGVADEINWGDVEMTALMMGLEGEFVTFEDCGFRMFVPNGFTAQAAQEGTLYLVDYVNSELGMRFAASYVPFGDWDMTFEEYAESKSTADNDAPVGTTNGIARVSYNNPDNDTWCMTYALTETDGVELIFGPASNPDVMTVANIIAASVQAV